MHSMDQLAMCTWLVRFHSRFSSFAGRVAEFASRDLILDSENF